MLVVARIVQLSQTVWPKSFLMLLRMGHMLRVSGVMVVTYEWEVSWYSFLHRKIRLTEVEEKMLLFGEGTSKAGQGLVLEIAWDGKRDCLRESDRLDDVMGRSHRVSG